MEHLDISDNPCMDEKAATALGQCLLMSQAPKGFLTLKAANVFTSPKAITTVIKNLAGIVKVMTSHPI